jgi:hypothetical protein
VVNYFREGKEFTIVEDISEEGSNIISKEDDSEQYFMVATAWYVFVVLMSVDIYKTCSFNLNYTLFSYDLFLIFMHVKKDILSIVHFVYPLSRSHSSSFV